MVLRRQDNGNWGGTKDRGYRRAAIMMWTRERSFAAQAEAARHLRGCGLSDAQQETPGLRQPLEPLVSSHARTSPAASPAARRKHRSVT